MKSTEVYRILRDNLAPHFKMAGFTRTKGFLSWKRPAGDRTLVVWCQVGQRGWDEYAGSEFTVEFQLADEQVPGYGRLRRRMPKMLGASAREELRTIQNGIISSFRRPPANHPLLHMNNELRSYYLKRFETAAEPYRERDDIWLRYGSEEHVVLWAQFIASHLSDCLKQTETWNISQT